MMKSVLVFCLLATSVSLSWAQDLSSEKLFDLMSQHVKEKEQDLIEIRHDLHRHPELSGAEVRTSKIVADHLQSLGFDVRRGVGGHGVVAVLEGSSPGPLVAFRADMDAVRSGAEDPVAYRSLVPGVRHICGHDIHTSVGLGIAEGFSVIKNQLAGSVMLVFQPAEESGTGAKAMLADGVFEQGVPDAFYSFHTVPYEIGEIATRNGGMISGRASISVKIEGNGDLSEARSIVRKALQKLDTNSTPDPQVEYFIRVELRNGGNQGSIQGQIMTAGYEDRMLAKNKVLAELESLNLEGASLEVDYDERFMEGVTNDSLLVSSANASISHFAPEIKLMEAGVASPMFSEDFGSFQVLVPGVMYYLGVNNTELGTEGMPHTPNYVADDASILVGTRAMLAAILGRLSAAP